MKNEKFTVGVRLSLSKPYRGHDEARYEHSTLGTNALTVY